MIYFTNKIAVILGLVIALLAAAGALYYYFQFLPNHAAQPAKPKIFRIGVIRTPPGLDSAWTGFQDEMKRLGYEEGKNVIYLVATTGNNKADAAKSAEEFIQGNVDLIYVMGVAGATATKEMTAKESPDTPVVFGVVSNPVGNNLVASIKSSGNNMTGISAASDLTVSKRAAMLLEMVPSTKRIVFPWNNPNTAGINDIRRAAQTLGIVLIDKQVADAADLNKFLNSFTFRSGDAIIRSTDSVMAANVQNLINVSLQKKIPLVGTNAADVASGALMSYGADYTVIGNQAARQADAIFKGARPSNLPIEFPGEFQLSVNLKTAKILGLTISPTFLAKVDALIQ